MILICLKQDYSKIILVSTHNCILWNYIQTLYILINIYIIIGTFKEATKKSKLYMEASDLSEIENSVEKKRKGSQSALCNHFNSKNKIAKKLHLGNDLGRCVDKKKSQKNLKYQSHNMIHHLLNQVFAKLVRCILYIPL